MNRLFKFAAAGAMAALLGTSAVSRATVIQQGQTATVGGWAITAPEGVGLIVTTSGSELLITKSANFTTPGEDLSIKFDQVSNSAASSVDFTSEQVTNNSGSAWTGFEFVVANTSGAAAKFSGVATVFVPPFGPGVDYTGVVLDVSKTTLTYTGTQASGATSSWGSSSPGDDLLILADPTAPGTVFSLEEISQPSGGAVVPLPAAGWHGLFGMLALGAVAFAKKLKSSIA